MLNGIGASIAQPTQPLRQASPAEASSPAPNILNVSGEEQSSILDIQLSEEEEKVVEELRARDQEVRTHENAHKSAGGSYVGAISYDTVTGPDGREYAVGGEAQIDASPIQGDPEATIRKMDIVIRAALAPAEPSSQDYAVARAAQQARLIAQQEAQEQRDAENSGGNSKNPALSSNDTDRVSQSSASSQNAEIIKAIQNLITASQLGG